VNTTENSSTGFPSDPGGSAGRDWEARYQAGDTPWDKGRAHPALVQWLSENRLTLSSLMKLKTDSELADALSAIAGAPCEDGACRK